MWGWEDVDIQHIEGYRLKVGVTYGYVQAYYVGSTKVDYKIFLKNNFCTYKGTI